MPALPKPARGSGILEREKRKADAKAVELAAKQRCKALDAYRCQWPERHKCRGGLEAAHIRDASLGGAMHPSNLVTLCAWIHRRGPESIHGKDLKMDGQRGAVEAVDASTGSLVVRCKGRRIELDLAFLSSSTRDDP